MKIENMRKGDWGKVKAFFDVSTKEGIVIKGFRLVEGINGLFASMPSRKGSDEQGNDKWFDTVWIESRALRDTLSQEAINEYNGSAGTQPVNMTPENVEGESTGSVGSNIAKNSEQNQAADYSSDNIDDDIPF